MPAFHELLDMPCLHLKGIGCLYILNGLAGWCSFFVEVCHATVFGRVG